MTLSEIIEILSIIFSTIIGAISIYYSNKAIKIASEANKLTAEITADANRPVVVAYLETVEIESFHKYMVIKNFGNTPATILDLKFMRSIDKYDFNMSSLIGCTIAPSQKFMHFINDETEGIVRVNIIYQTATGQHFDEVYQVKLNATEKLFWIGNGEEDKQLKFMKDATEAFIKVLK